jgi:hypothetical protein
MMYNARQQTTARKSSQARHTSENHAAASAAAKASQTAMAGKAARQSLAMAVMEAIEGREYMSASPASIVLTDGVLTLRAAPNVSSQLIVNLSDGGKEINAYVTGGGHDHFAVNDVSSIQMFGSDRSDFLYINPRLKIASVMNTGQGNDSVHGGGGNDTIIAGNGNDLVQGNGGNDSIIAGDGNDSINSGVGNDFVQVTQGNNHVRGGSGNDTLIAGAGHDRIIAGTGDDSLVGGIGNDTLVGGSGHDTLVAGSGANVLVGGSGQNMIVKGQNSKVRPGRHTTVSTAAPTPVVSTPNGTGNGSSIGNTGSTSSTGTGGTSPSTGGTTTGSGTGTTSGTGTGSTGTTGSTGSTGSKGSTGSTGGTTGSTGSKGTTGGTGSTGSTGGTVGSPTGSTVTVGTVSVSAGVNSGGSLISNVPNYKASTTLAHIDILEPNGMAGHTVHVNGLNSTLKVGDPLSSKYQWDFGDANSRFDTLTGFNAAHVYENAGTFTVTLTVTDSAGNVSVAKGTVTISADTRRKIYVDTVAGSDSNTGATPTLAVATAARAAELMGNNTELLFHNGQQFDVANTIALNYTNVLIGTYGSGAMARVVKVTGNGASIFNLGNASDGVLAQGIEFDSMWDINKYGDKKVNVRAFFVAGKNFAVRDSRFLNLDDGVNTAGYPTGVLVQDNYFGPQIRGCCIWGEGYDQVYIGNTMTNSTQEHLIRTSGIGVTRLLVEDNNMSRPDNSKGSLELRTASWFYVSGNRIDGGTLRFGLPNGPDNQSTGWGVVENNETYKFFVMFRPGVQHVAFRDNVIHYDSGAAIILETMYSVPRSTVDIRIDHNTAISNSGQGKFLKLDGPATNISVTNNLFVGPNLQWVGESTGALYVVGKDLSSFSAISGNIWPQMSTDSKQAGDNYLLPVTGDIVNGYQTAAEWASHSQVKNEQYASAKVGGNVYSMTLNGITAGALPSLFNTNTYKLAA